jgi:hypothetical protein
MADSGLRLVITVDSMSLPGSGATSRTRQGESCGSAPVTARLVLSICGASLDSNQWPVQLPAGLTRYSVRDPVRQASCGGELFVRDGQERNDQPAIRRGERDGARLGEAWDGHQEKRKERGGEGRGLEKGRGPRAEIRGRRRDRQGSSIGCEIVPKAFGTLQMNASCRSISSFPRASG